MHCANAEAASQSRQAESPVGSLPIRDWASTLNTTMPVTASHKQGAAERAAAPLAVRLSSNVLQPSAQLQTHAPSAHTHASPPQHLPEQATNKGKSCRHTGSARVRHSRKRRDACKASAAQETDPSQINHVKRHRQGLAVVAPGPDTHHSNPFPATSLQAAVGSHHADKMPAIAPVPSAVWFQHVAVFIIQANNVLCVSGCLTTPCCFAFSVFFTHIAPTNQFFVNLAHLLAMAY